MSEILLLITGAGASYDILPKGVNVSSDPDFRPPLTASLFSGENDSQRLRLNEHPIANFLGQKFHKEVMNNPQVQLESFLMNLRNEKRHEINKQYFSVPVYLFSLFSHCSDRYIRGRDSLPNNYYHLIDYLIHCERYNQIIWLNLNYDLFADSAIEYIFGCGLSNMNSYLNISTNDGDTKLWYIKPHGSIDWWYDLVNHQSLTLNDFVSQKIFTNFKDLLDPAKIYVARYKNISKEKTLEIHGKFPALSVPVGKYEFIYPDHKEAIKPMLKNVTEVLSIGFSALDNDILDLLGNELPTIKKIKIVNGSKDSGERVWSILDKKLRLETGSRNSIFDGGFADFVFEIKGWHPGKYAEYRQKLHEIWGVPSDYPLS